MSFFGDIGNFVSSAVHDVSNLAGDAINGAANLAGDAINGAANLAGSAVGGLTGLAGNLLSRTNFSLSYASSNGGMISGMMGGAMGLSGVLSNLISQGPCSNLSAQINVGMGNFNNFFNFGMNAASGFGSSFMNLSCWGGNGNGDGYGYGGPGPGGLGLPKLIPIPRPVYTLAGQTLNGSVALSAAVAQQIANAVGGNVNNTDQYLKYNAALEQNAAQAETRQLAQMQASNATNSNNSNAIDGNPLSPGGGSGGSSATTQLSQDIQNKQNIAALFMSKATEGDTILQQETQEQNTQGKMQSTAIGNIYSLENAVIQGMRAG